MENYNQVSVETRVGAKDNSKRLLASAFSWMSLAMVLSTIFALLFSNIPALTMLLLDVNLVTQTASPSILGWIVTFAPLGLVLLMSVRVNKMSLPALIACFVIYSAVTGMSLAFVLLYYSVGSVVTCFFSTTALFGVFALAGYFTKTDLTKLGSILMIGVIGLVIASIINYFAGSSTMEFIISFLGVIIFTGLTAYDVQKLKNMGNQVSEGESLTKAAIMGALSLYLDFINIFLFLLRLFGSRD